MCCVLCCRYWFVAAFNCERERKVTASTPCATLGLSRYPSYPRHRRAQIPPGAAVAAVSPVPVQMWPGEPGPGVDVAGVSPVPVQMWPGEPGPGADVVAVGLFEVGHLSGSDSAKERGPTPVTIMART